MAYSMHMANTEHYLKATPEPEQFLVKRADGRWVGNVHQVDASKWAATVQGKQQFGRRFFATADEAAAALVELSEAQ